MIWGGHGVGIFGLSRLQRSNVGNVEQEGLSHFPKSLPALLFVTLNVEQDLLHQLSFELGKSDICSATWKATEITATGASLHGPHFSC